MWEFLKKGTVLLIPACIVACSSGGPKPPPPMTLYVDPTVNVNDGRMVYMVARNVNEKQFINESYDSIVTKAFPEAEDASLLGGRPVYPGERCTMTFATPVKGTVAVYFMFTDPGAHWKNILELPLNDGYEIELPGQNLVDVGSKPWFFKRWFLY